MAQAHKKGHPRQSVNPASQILSFEGREYLDDRMFVLEIARALPSSPPNATDMPWILVTRRNVRGYPPTRADDFATWQAAADYVRQVEPTTPRISLGGRSPDPVPTYDEFVAWCRGCGVRSALS